MEVIFGALFVWWALVGLGIFRLIVHPFTVIQPVFWLLTGVLLLIIVLSDWFYGLIPVGVVVVGGVTTLLYRLALYMTGQYQGSDLVLALGAALGAWGLFAFLRAVTKGKGMGEGDVILAPWLGLLTGYPRVIVAIWLAFVIGAAIAVPLVVMGKTRLKATLPFAPFMIIGTMLSLWWGARWWEWINF